MLPLALLLGCVVEQWRAADLQIDVAGAGLGDEDRVRICVLDAGEHEQAVGEGRVAVTGMPAQGELTVAISALDEDGSSSGGVGPVVLDSDYLALDWQPCEACDPCQDGGQRVPNGAQDRLLAIRFTP